MKHQDNSKSQVCLTLSQNRHSKDRDTSHPLYIGLSNHTQTRSKKLINRLHRLGISISYKCVVELNNSLANSICLPFEIEGVVFPAHLRKGLRTIGTLDNLDHNPSATTAQGSFHGTGISIFQFPNSGNSRDPIVIQANVIHSTEYSLPDHYTNIPAVTCKTGELALPDARLT